MRLFKEGIRTIEIDGIIYNMLTNEEVSAIESRIADLESKLDICVEALKKYQDYAIKEGYADPVFVAKEALEKIGKNE